MTAPPSSNRFGWLLLGAMYGIVLSAALQSYENAWHGYSWQTSLDERLAWYSALVVAFSLSGVFYGHHVRDSRLPVQQWFWLLLLAVIVCLSICHPLAMRPRE